MSVARLELCMRGVPCPASLRQNRISNKPISFRPFMDQYYFFFITQAKLNEAVQQIGLPSLQSVNASVEASVEQLSAT